jgi:hypothetical protein
MLAALVLASVAALAWGLCSLLDGDRFPEREAVLASPDVEEAVQVLREMAADHERFTEYLSAEAPPMARRAVGAAARRMAGAESVKPVGANWVGDYLRLRVRCPLPKGRHFAAHFFLKREDGRFRVTGAEASR